MTPNDIDTPIGHVPVLDTEALAVVPPRKAPVALTLDAACLRAGPRGAVLVAAGAIRVRKTAPPGRIDRSRDAADIAAARAT